MPSAVLNGWDGATRKRGAEPTGNSAEKSFYPMIGLWKDVIIISIGWEGIVPILGETSSLVQYQFYNNMRSFRFGRSSEGNF